jgi:hypothetical protein
VILLLSTRVWRFLSATAKTSARSTGGADIVAAGETGMWVTSDVDMCGRSVAQARASPYGERPGLLFRVWLRNRLRHCTVSCNDLRFRFGRVQCLGEIGWYVWIPVFGG